MSVNVIRHVTWVGFWVNAALMIIKIVVGITGKSDALVADGIHSLSDFATDFIVLALVGIAYRGADSDHPYGHGKYETFGALLIAIILIIVAAGIGWGGIDSVIRALRGEVLPRPDMLTMIVAIVAIAAKEILYRYTLHQGRIIDSPSLIANAWHHRSDAISSIATLVGVSISYFLGESWRILDPIASILIAVFIAISALEIARPSVNELLEKSLPSETLDRLSRAITSVPGVKAFHHLRSRRNGHSYLVEVHIKVDPDITVTQGHAISTAVEIALRAILGLDSIITVHVEPYHQHQLS